MLVPLMVLVAVVPPIHALRTLTPGAKISIKLPKLEKDARVSVESDAATVIAEGSLAGEKSLASAPEFPAATVTVTPAETAPATAELTDAENPPPRDIVRTEWGTALVATHWIPEMTPAKVPDPFLSRTLTATSLAFLEIP
jgi:hypothetical protein